MDADAMSLFFSLLLIGGGIGLVGALLSTAGRASIAQVGLPLAATIAVGATAGSLYLSEIAGFAPCELCWFQRIAMYPLAVVLVIAAIRRDYTVLAYVRVIAGIGLVIALYHSQLQAFPDQGSFCELANPCTSSPVKALGWMTIPHMSALSFAGLIVLTTLARPQHLQAHAEQAHDLQAHDLQAHAESATRQEVLS